MNWNSTPCHCEPSEKVLALYPMLRESFRRHFGCLPPARLVVDLQTTGRMPNDLIVQISLFWCTPGRPDKNEHMILDWTLPAYGMDESWLSHRLRKSYDYHNQTLSSLVRSGMDPMKALASCLTWLKELQPAVLLIGYSLHLVKLPALIRHVFKWLGVSLDRRKMNYWDAGLIHQAVSHGIPIGPGESLIDYHERLYAKHLPWLNLGACLKYYGVSIEFSADDPTCRPRAAYEIFLAQKQILGV